MNFKNLMNKPQIKIGANVNNYRRFFQTKFDFMLDKI
jgi:hypothetical protein